MANEPLQHGRYYHIYNRGNNGENLFVQPRNYLYFLQRYTKYIQPIAETYAYCLLPNHFHFAIRTYTEEEQEAYHHANQIGSIFKLIDPSRAFNNFFIAYARAFNNTTQRTGVLFETPFGRKPIDNHNYLMIVITYIHHNPQKHGFVSDFREWAWSSYGAMLTDKPTKLNREEVLAWYNGRSQFTEAHTTDQDKQLIAPLVLEDWW